MLEDILVLRVENGKDLFVTVNANYARSCYGIAMLSYLCYK